MELPAGNLSVHGEGRRQSILGSGCAEGAAGDRIRGDVPSFEDDDRHGGCAAKVGNPRAAFLGQGELLAHDSAGRLAWGSWEASRVRDLPPYGRIKVLAKKVLRAVIVRLAAGIEDQHLAPQLLRVPSLLDEKNQKADRSATKLHMRSGPELLCV